MVSKVFDIPQKKKKIYKINNYVIEYHNIHIYVVFKVTGTKLGHNRKCLTPGSTYILIYNL